MNIDDPKMQDMRTLAKEKIGPLIDKHPDWTLRQLADFLNQEGHVNKAGRPINKNSISWGLFAAFGNKYRRREKCTKIPYKDRQPRINLNVRAEIHPDTILIESTIQEPYPQSVSGGSGPSVIDSLQPSGVSPRELVAGVIEGDDAKEHWRQDRIRLGLEAGPEIDRQLKVLDVIDVKPSDLEYYHSNNQFIKGEDVRRLKAGVRLKVINPEDPSKYFEVDVSKAMMQTIERDLRRYGTGVKIRIKDKLWDYQK